MVYELSCSAKQGISISCINWRLMYNILPITRSCLSCGLIFNMNIMSIMLYMDNPISSSPFQISFSRWLVFEMYSVSNFEVWCRLVCNLLWNSEFVFIQCFLCYDLSQIMHFQVMMSRIWVIKKALHRFQ